MKKETREWTVETVYTPPEKRDITDYLYLFPKGCTLEYRRKYDIGDIFINGAICLHCKDFIRSRNRHDYRTCKCGKVSVDGGSWYVKRVGNQQDYIDVIELYNDTNVGPKSSIKNDNPGEV